jgi:hypothetical protein
MHVDVDESRRDDLTGGIDGSRGRRVDSARDRRDLVAANADVGSIPGASRSINHPGVPDDEVVGACARNDTTQTPTRSVSQNVERP